MRRIATAVVALCVAALSTTLAQDTTRTYELDPIVVTGTNTGTARSLLPNAVTVVSMFSLGEGGEPSVFPALNRQVPGLFVTERGVVGFGVGPGAAGGITIRGAGGSPTTQVLVMTDGRPSMMGLFGHPLPDMYMTSGVDRVEVIRGPASLVHGTNAFGGVVNIISRPGVPAGLHGNAGVSYGSYRTQKYEAGLRAGLGATALRATGNHYSTDGHRPYSSFRSSTASVRASSVLSSDFALSVDGQYTTFRTYDPGPASNPSLDHWVDAKRGNAGFTLSNKNDLLEGALKGYVNFGHHEVYDGFLSDDADLGLLLHQGVRLSEGTVLMGGADYKRYGGNASNVVASVDFGRFFVNEFGVYGMIQQDLFGLLRLNAGLRLNHHELSGDVLIPQAGIAVNPSGGTTFKASVGRGFRSPTVRELYLFPAPTPTLQPEDAWSYETGLVQRVSEQVVVEITGYILSGKNLIRTSGQFPNLTLSNSGTFTHRGIETAGAIRLSPFLTLDANYTYLDPGQQTQGSPRHKLYSGGRYDTGDWSISASLFYVSGLYGADQSMQPLRDYVLLSARAGLTILGVFQVYLSGDNLLNVEYATVYDYPMPGRMITAGILWEM